MKRLIAMEIDAGDEFCEPCQCPEEFFCQEGIECSMQGPGWEEGKGSKRGKECLSAEQRISKLVELLRESRQLFDDWSENYGHAALGDMRDKIDIFLPPNMKL